MKRIEKIVLALVFGIVATFGVATPTFADDDDSLVQIQISPVSNRVTLNPNDELTYTMTVDNVGSKKFKFRVYAAPYSISNESYDVSFTNETNRTQITRWITFNTNKSAKKDSEKKWAKEATFVVDGHGRQEVEYKISVPKDIPAGGQYAMIFAETVPDDSTPEATGVRTISRIGLILYGNTTGETVEKATLSDFNMQGVMLKGNITASLNSKNEGNTDFSTNVSMEVKNVLTGKTDTVDKSYDVLPDSPTRNIKVEWDKTPGIGIFNVHTVATALDQTIDETRTVVIVPVWLIIIMLLLLTFIIVWLIILIRKRRAKKARLIV